MREKKKCKQKNDFLIQRSLPMRNAEGKALQEGITLIALILTIIIMLILVAVSITILVKSDLIGTTKTATTKMQEQMYNESTIGNQIQIGEKNYNSIEDYIKDETDKNNVEETLPKKWFWNEEVSPCNLKFNFSCLGQNFNRFNVSSGTGMGNYNDNINNVNVYGSNAIGVRNNIWFMGIQRI